jgi:hypothetical protein
MTEVPQSNLRRFIEAAAYPLLAIACATIAVLITRTMPAPPRAEAHSFEVIELYVTLRSLDSGGGLLTYKYRYPGPAFGGDDCREPRDVSPMCPLGPQGPVPEPAGIWL